MKMMTLLTEPLFFDTDCISAFLWVNNESILAKLFPGRIIIPKQVYDELSNPSVNRIKELKNQIDIMIKNKQAVVESIEVGTNEYELYKKLTTSRNQREKIIGKGEAASLSMAKERNGIIASNNLKDISFYVKKYSLKHYTTGDIMMMALEEGYIDENQGNIVWENMISKRRKLGYLSFSDYIKAHSKLK